MTVRRAKAALLRAAPALLVAVAVAVAWTALALGAPMITTGNAAPLVAIVVAGFGAAVLAVRRDTRRALPHALIAGGGTSLLIFLVIELILPDVPGFIGNTHPPVYTPVTRLVDPVGEFGIFVLLAAALGILRLRARIRARRAGLREQGRGYGGGPNEMVVERPSL